MARYYDYVQMSGLLVCPSLMYLSDWKVNTWWLAKNHVNANLTFTTRPVTFWFQLTQIENSLSKGWNWVSLICCCLQQLCHQAGLRLRHFRMKPILYYEAEKRRFQSWYQCNRPDYMWSVNNERQGQRSGPPDNLENVSAKCPNTNVKDNRKHWFGAGNFNLVIVTLIVLAIAR
jgi:hypothetical protein